MPGNRFRLSSFSSLNPTKASTNTKSLAYKKPNMNANNSDSLQTSNANMFKPNVENTKFYSKIVVLGASAVGKTAIIHQFLYNKFPEVHNATVDQLYHTECDLMQGMDNKFTLDILDTSGSYEFPAMKRLAIENADAFLLIYSVDDANSFEEVRKLREQIYEIKSAKYAIQKNEINCKIKSNSEQTLEKNENLNKNLLNQNVNQSHFQPSSQLRKSCYIKREVKNECKPGKQENQDKEKLTLRKFKRSPVNSARRYSNQTESFICKSPVNSEPKSKSSDLKQNLIDFKQKNNSNSLNLEQNCEQNFNNESNLLNSSRYLTRRRFSENIRKYTNLPNILNSEGDNLNSDDSLDENSNEESNQNSLENINLINYHKNLINHTQQKSPKTRIEKIKNFSNQNSKPDELDEDIEDLETIEILQNKTLVKDLNNLDINSSNSSIFSSCSSCEDENEGKKNAKQSIETTKVPVIIVVAGNKCDLENNKRAVQKNIAETIVQFDWDNGFIECSAKNNTNVVEIFKELTKRSNLPFEVSLALDNQKIRRRSLPAYQSNNKQSNQKYQPKRNSCALS